MLATLTDVGREQLTAWAGAHECRMDAALAALDDDDRAALTAAPPALFQLAENPAGPEDGLSSGADTG